MPDHEEQATFVDVHFDVTQERIKSFLQQFAPTCKGYVLDQTPNQLHSKEFIIRIYYEEQASLTLTCYSPEMIQQRIQNIFNINNEVKFINHHPNIEKHTFSLPKKGKEDITTYYTAILEFEFTKA